MRRAQYIGRHCINSRCLINKPQLLHSFSTEGTSTSTKKTHAPKANFTTYVDFLRDRDPADPGWWFTQYITNNILQGFVPVQQATNLGRISTLNFPASNGKPPTRNSGCMSLYWWHIGHWRYRWRAHWAHSQGPAETQWSRDEVGESKERVLPPISWVPWLHYTISADGLDTSDDKVSGILKAPATKDVTELRSFPRLVKYVW